MTNKTNTPPSTIKSDVLKRVAEANKSPEPVSSAQANKARPPIADNGPKFQHYASSRGNIRLVTAQGIPISFVNFKYITDNAHCIEYLDSEIALGIGIITKGELMTAKEADPMEALRAKFIAEYEAERAAEVPNDMGTTAANGIVPGSIKLNPSSTAAATDMAADSSSTTS
jgi:hypothetical protein